MDIRLPVSNRRAKKWGLWRSAKVAPPCGSSKNILQFPGSSNPWWELWFGVELHLGGIALLTFCAECENVCFWVALFQIQHSDSCEMCVPIVTMIWQRSGRCWDHTLVWSALSLRNSVFCPCSFSFLSRWAHLCHLCVLSAGKQASCQYESNSPRRYTLSWAAVLGQHLASDSQDSPSHRNS